MTVRAVATAGFLALALLLMPVLAASARAADDAVVITIKDHRFDPETVEVPAGKKVKLLIRNQDPGPEEFESYSLNREKVIAGNSEGVVFIGPLDPGIYDFFGEFHEDTAQGKIVAK